MEKVKTYFYEIASVSFGLAMIYFFGVLSFLPMEMFYLAEGNTIFYMFVFVCFGIFISFLLLSFYREKTLIIMRFIDALMSLPMILLALTIASLLGGGLNNIIIALGISLMSVYARLMCGQVLTVKENDYILAESSMGASNTRMMLFHILPNCFPPLIVLIPLMMGATILAEAGLSFLGIGVDPPTAAWGAMVSDGYKYLRTSPVLSFAPGLAIMLVVFAFNMVGDGLRDALDPRLRGLL